MHARAENELLAHAKMFGFFSKCKWETDYKKLFNLRPPCRSYLHIRNNLISISCATTGPLQIVDKTGTSGRIGISADASCQELTHIGAATTTLHYKHGTWRSLQYLFWLVPQSFGVGLRDHREGCCAAALSALRSLQTALSCSSFRSQVWH